MPRKRVQLPVLYTVNQVAGFFQVTPYTVRVWINSPNGMQAIKTESGTWRIPEEEVKRWANLRYGAQ